MKTIELSKIALLFSLLFLLATSCKKEDSGISSDPKTTIVGKWHVDKIVSAYTPITGTTGGKTGTETDTYTYDNWLTFNANGTFNGTGKNNDGTAVNESGSYSISGNKLTITGELETWDIITLNSSNLVLKTQVADDENNDGVKDTNVTFTGYYSR